MNKLSMNRLPYRWLLPLPIVLIVYALLSAPVDVLLHDYIKLLTHPIPGVHDYFATCGIVAPSLNAGIVGLIVLGLLRYNKLPMNANGISTLFLMMGFSYIGKNALNFVPFVIGGYLYAKLQGIAFKRVLVASLLSSCLAPLVDFGLLLSPFNVFFDYIIASFIGIFIGLIAIPISSHILLTHQGYNLYNMGYAAGFIGIVVVSVLKGIGLEVKQLSTISMAGSKTIVWVLVLFYIYFIALGIYYRTESTKPYHQIFFYSGRLVTDFTRILGPSLTMLNMGIMGFIALAFVLSFNVALNGPILAGIFTLTGFSSFGNHPKNTLPIMFGALLSVLFISHSLSLSSGMVVVLFATTLAPIAGEYGMLAGVFVGLLHTTLVSSMASLHGGMNLYNNGFSGGIIATLVVPVIDAYKKEK